MRYLMWAIGSFLVCTALPAAAQDTTGPPEGSESNIFEHLQIKLLDLEKMGCERAPSVRICACTPVQRPRLVRGTGVRSHSDWLSCRSSNRRVV